MNWASPSWFNGFWLIVLLTLFFFWREERRKRGLEKFISAPLWDELVNADRFRQRLKWLFLFAAILFLVLALARPQKKGDSVKVERKGIDLIVALDTSSSMRAQDFKPDRFAKAKREISSLMSNLKGDRVGIIAFSGVSFLQCPLTLDYRAAKLFAEAMEVDMLPRPGTAIGDAIRTAIRAFDHKGPQKKVVVLITDGEDHGSRPMEAAEQAQAMGVKIFCIGIGKPDGEPIPVVGARGKVSGYKKDEEGNVILSRLGEQILREVALKTGGSYYRATTGELELERIYKEIEGFEKGKFEEDYVTKYEEQFFYLLWMAFLLLCVEMVIGERKVEGRRLKVEGETKNNTKGDKDARAIHESQGLAKERPAGKTNLQNDTGSSRERAIWTYQSNETSGGINTCEYSRGQRTSSQERIHSVSVYGSRIKLRVNNTNPSNSGTWIYNFGRKREISHSLWGDYSDVKWFNSSNFVSSSFHLPPSTFYLILLSCFLIAWKPPVEHRNAKGNELYKKQNYEEALEVYQDAQSDAPQKPELNYNVGNALYQQKKYDPAKESYQESVMALDSKLRANAYYNLGSVQFRKGDLRDSLRLFEKALELNPKDEDTRYNIELIKKLLEKHPPPPPEQQQQEQQQQQDQKQDKGGGGSQDQQDQQGQEQEKRKQEAKGKNQEEKTEDRGQKTEDPEQKEQQEQENQQDQGEEGSMDKSGGGTMSRQEADRILDALEERPDDVGKLFRNYYPKSKEEPPEKDW